MSVTLSFLGAAGTVTGSKYLLETSKAKVLIDCGLYQGDKDLRERNWAPFPVKASSIDAVVLTHAHLDHVGYLPRVVRQGFHGPIYCSRATGELARIILEDSAKLQEEEAEYRNRKGLTVHHPAQPLYDDHDVQRTLRQMRPVRAMAGTEVPIAPGVTGRFYPAGHLLGARSVLLEAEGVRILFSGDVGRWGQPILPDPAEPPVCDYLIVESTYGDRLHGDEDPREALADVIRDAQRRNAPVLIPAFAVGRTQDILYHIRELEDAGRVPVIRVRADSPMAAEATRAFLRCAEEHDEEMVEASQYAGNALETNSMIFASTQAESRRLNDEVGARVIVASAGMLTGGRVLHHALRILPDPEATLCFVGYQSPGTTGRRILDGEPEVRIMKQWVPVRCRVRSIGGFSGHADYEELLRWMQPLAAQPPKGIFVTHGEPEASAAMIEHIRERFGWSAEAPSYGDRVGLNG